MEEQGAVDVCCTSLGTPCSARMSTGISCIRGRVRQTTHTYMPAHRNRTTWDHPQWQVVATAAEVMARAMEAITVALVVPEALEALGLVVVVVVGAEVLAALGVVAGLLAAMAAASMASANPGL